MEIRTSQPYFTPSCIAGLTVDMSCAHGMAGQHVRISSKPSSAACMQPKIFDSIGGPGARIPGHVLVSMWMGNQRQHMADL